MPATATVSPSLPHQQQAQHHVSQGDLDILSLLTADGPNSNKRKGLPRRDQPLDSLLLTAVLAGSDKVTRHHFGHGTMPYAACDESRPQSPMPPRKSMQAPRSERIAKQQAEEAVEQLAKAAAPAAPVPAAAPAPVTAERKRRMSIDPQPVSQLLQQASPAHVNFYHGRGMPIGKPSGQPQVKCMARTRVPTPHGEVFLHLYHNSHDNKEHLAIVMDPIQLDPEARAAAPKGRKEIRSRSLDAVWRDGETEMERVVRGAYVGRLHPGGEGQASKPKSQAEYNAEDAMGEDDEADIRPLVRIHSECFTGETIGSLRCDCGEQLDEAMRRIAEPQRLPSDATSEYLPTPEASRAPSPHQRGQLVPGRGVVIYMRQEGRGIGLLEKIRAYNLQDLGHDTVTANLMLGHGADERTYAVAAEILRDLGLAGDEALGKGGVRLLTNNPEKVVGLSGEGIRISDRVGMVPRDWQCRHDCPSAAEEKEYDEWRARRAGVGLLGATTTRAPELDKYLRTKIERMGHMIDIPESTESNEQAQ